jgi:cation diffusion facilitator family transporter
MDERKYMDLKRGEKGAIVSIAAYLVLSVSKLAIGYLADSQALRADGLNNATDILASLAVLIGLRFSRKPPDRDHAYGHWKSEAIASLVASFIMFAVGVQVLSQGVQSLFAGRGEPPDIAAGYFGLVAAVFMYGVYRYNRRLAMNINSRSLMAAAKDNRSDAWVSAGASVGIFGSQLDMPWLDAAAALAVGLLICKTAWDIFRESTHQLTDGFDNDKLEAYRETARAVPGVKDIRSIKGRYYGNNAAVDLVITVHADLTIHEAHDISTSVENALKEKHGIYDVHVHVEPGA